MLFSSLTFLFYFLPLLIVVYYLVPKSFRNLILLFFSIIFYAWGGVSYSAILIVSILANFGFVKGMEKSINAKKTWLTVGLIFNILLISIFKYLDFFIGNINGIGHLVNGNDNIIPLQNIILPVGISFFTFQQMSMLWDVYKDPKIKSTNLRDTALYISLFPQLIAGPIVRFNDIIDQIKNRTESIVLIRSGVARFILGLFKKIIIANTCGSLADTIINSNIDTINAPIAWLGIIAYAFQIYFDFSGYSDMAIGLGRIFGFRIIENFNFPYTSKSIQEFWRRWHISLSTWFRDYVYIPLGGNRKGPFRTYFNLMLVFLLTGFWHGATWSFIIWGLFHGIFLMLEKYHLGKVLKKLPWFISWTYTMIVVLIGWTLFRIEELPDALHYIGKLFGFGTSPSYHVVSYFEREIILVLTLAFLSSSTFFTWIQKKFTGIQNSFPRLYLISQDIVLLMMLFISVVYINSGSYNPFIYFRF